MPKRKVWKKTKKLGFLPIFLGLYHFSDLLAHADILGSVTGLHKCISWFRNINLYLYVFVMAFVVLAIDLPGILEIFCTSIGDYLQNFISTSLYLEPIAQTGWVGSNNTFFFACWMVFAPFSGLFLVKLAYGRTIRQFVLVNMIVLSIFVLAWFAFIGGSAILLDSQNGGADAAYDGGPCKSHAAMPGI